MRIHDLIVQALMCNPIVIALSMLQPGDEKLFVEFYVVHNHTLVGSVISSHPVYDDFQCSYKCAQNSNCLSFNYGSGANKEMGICELSSSEKVLQPLKLIERKNFHYYGIYDNCLLSPCLCVTCYNGGTCIMESRGKYGCKCPLKVASLPFLDKNCSIDKTLIATDPPKAGVTLAMISGARYNWTFYEAQRVCQILGGSLATYDQLLAAWKEGMQSCRYGWLADGTVRYPRRVKHQLCGNNEIGLIGSSEPVDKNNRYDAYCYIK